MKLKTLTIKILKKLAWVTINRPKKLNALNSQTLAELHHALMALEEDNKVRVVVLTGAGDTAFVAGADICELADLTPTAGAALAQQGNQKVFDYIEHYNKPVIAAVNGYALGGGLELAMACHLRVFANTAKLGMPETSLGLIPGYGGTQRLPQLVGRGRAMELLLTGDMIDAQRAYEIGLANMICHPAALKSKVEDLVAAIVKNAPQAQQQLLAAVCAGFDPRTDGYAAESEAFGACFGTDNFVQGTQAFLHKRKHKF
jgi:enoyl-CoA hydratase